MDISELLASMQTDPGNRALARRTKMGAPTADGSDPSADAGGTAAIPDQPTADASQGAVDASQAEAPTQAQGAIPDMPAPAPAPNEADTTQNFAKGGTVKKYANGGDVEIEGMRERERTAIRAEQQNDREVQRGRSGADAAIMDLPDDYDSRPLPENEKYTGKPLSGPTQDPANLPGGEDYYGDSNHNDPQGVKARYQAQADSRTKGGKARVWGTPGGDPGDGAGNPTQDAPPDDWREPAHQAINAGIAYGHKKHVPNAPLDDGTGEQRVGAMLSGDGSTPHQQVKALEQGVDPDNTMDPSSRTLKAAQVANDFYSKQGPDGGAAAVWGILQGKRKEFNAHAAAASVNNDNGKPENAAQLAEGALNTVPDGLHATVKPSRDIDGGSPFDNINDGIVAGAKAVGRGLAAARDYIGKTPKQAASEKAQADYNYMVNLADPDSGKAIYSGTLNKEQLNDLMSHGWDKMLHGGTQAALEQSANKTEGHGHIAGDSRPNGDSLRPATNDGQQDVAEINGIPRGTNIKNMSVGQVSGLRKATAAGRVQGNERERIVDKTNASRERVVDAQQQGLNQRLGSAPGQQAANRRKALDQAAKDAKDKTFKDDAERQAYIDKQADHYLEILHAQMNPQGGGAPAKPQGGAAPAGAPQPGEVRKGYKYMGGPPGDPSSWQKAQ